MPNVRLKLAAPAVQASATDVGARMAPLGPQLNRSISGKAGNEHKATIGSTRFLAWCERPPF